LKREDVKTIPLFTSIPKRRYGHVARWVDELSVEVGTTLTMQGDVAREFFVIVSGTADVVREGERVASLRPGEFFGEIGLLAPNRVRTATVTAAAPMRLLVVSSREFSSMVGAFRRVGELVRRTAAERSNANAELRRARSGWTTPR
jgi:CRP-like cAMP-binding protein